MERMRWHRVKIIDAYGWLSNRNESVWWSLILHRSDGLDRIWARTWGNSSTQSKRFDSRLTLADSCRWHLFLLFFSQCLKSVLGHIVVVPSNIRFYFIHASMLFCFLVCRPSFYLCSAQLLLYQIYRCIDTQILHNANCELTQPGQRWNVSK